MLAACTGATGVFPFGFGVCMCGAEGIAAFLATGAALGASFFSYTTSYEIPFTSTVALLCSVTFTVTSNGCSSMVILNLFIISTT